MNGNGRAAMHAQGAGQEKATPRNGWTPWTVALLLSAALTGLLASGACRVTMTGADAMLRTRVEKGLDDTLALMRLSGTAGSVATVVTQLETAPTLPLRQSLHPALNQRVQQLGDAVDALLRSQEAERDRIATLRASAAALRAGVEDLNRAVDERLAVEHELRAVLEQVGARLAEFMETLDSLPPGGSRPAIEEAARALGAQLLDAGLSRVPMPKAATAAPRAAFRKTADTLLDALNALRIDHLSPRRAEAARRLVALGVDSGNLFDLRQEQARLAATAADTADALRARAEDVATQSGRLAQALRDSTLAERDRIAADLTYGPVGTGLAAALAVLAAGGLLGAVAAARTRRARVAVGPTAVELPAEAPPDAAAGSAEAGSANERPPLHILLAEDEPVNQMAAMAILRRAGHRVTLACDGRAALAAVERDGCDLVLMDLRMPEMDGIEATRRIVSRPGDARPRIVMLTASAVPGDRERALAAGADEVLEKPLRYDALRPVLDRLFASARPAAAVQPPPSDTPPFADPPFDAPPFDAPPFDDGAVRQMRDLLPAERVAALVTGTVNTLNQYHARLAEAWAAGDTATVGAMAHKIAGVSGVYGCVALRGTAQALERAVETGEGDAADLVRQTTAALAPAVAFLEGQLAAV